MGPVGSGERVAAVDVLRGCALMGILVINITAFALPDAASYKPALAGGFSGWNYAVWFVSYLFFDQKMMSIFSMLFGAGLVLMTERSDARGVGLRGIYYRRVGWLLVFGLLHAYFLWEGDILYSYAVCGLLLFPFRRLATTRLIALGLVVFLTAVPISAAIGLRVKAMHDEGPDAAADTGGPAAWIRQELRSYLEDALESITPEGIEKNLRTYRGGYWQLFRERATDNVADQTLGFIMWAGPRAGGLMLLGMGLMKLGVFTGKRPTRLYAGMAVFGYGVGLPIVGYGMWDLTTHDFEIFHSFIVGNQFNYLGSLAVALGHVGTVMLLYQSGLLRWLFARLAAAGRMALTNYLMQTLICTTLFFGWGFGLYGRLDRMQLAGVIAAVWLFQLAVSPVWLRHFRFGPMEWLWRSLTYWQLQPMRAASA
jgi:uncharacterized protein